MLEFKNVSKRYGDSVVLKKTDIQIASGETTVLIGPSGCGKSTLLRLVAGLITPDSGHIVFEDTPLQQENLAALRRRMGYVIQQGGLFPHFTVARNVTLMASQLKWPPLQIEARLHELAELVRIPQSMLQRYPAELSGGQYQRVSLMRALMLDPDLLLLDEPLGALDPIVRFELQQELKAIFSRLGKTVIMVTHDIAEAAYFGHTLVLLREGEVVQQGGLEALLKNPAHSFVSRFIDAQREPMLRFAEALAT